MTCASPASYSLLVELATAPVRGSTYSLRPPAVRSATSWLRKSGAETNRYASRRSGAAGTAGRSRGPPLGSRPSGPPSGVGVVVAECSPVGVALADGVGGATDVQPSAD